MEGLEIKKRLEELKLPIEIEEGSKTLYMCKSLPWGFLFNFAVLMIIMEIYSSDGWKEMFILKEKIYVETAGRRNKLIEEDDAIIYEYLRNLRQAAKMHNSSMESLVIESKWRILDNIISKADRDVLERCPEMIKRSRTDPQEWTELRDNKLEDIIVISSEEEEAEKQEDEEDVDMSIEIKKLKNTKLRGDCSFKGLNPSIRLTLEAALIIMEVHNLKKLKQIFRAGDIIYERGKTILIDDSRIKTFFLALDMLSEQKNKKKRKIVINLKDIHTSVFHSDKVFESLNIQPFKYKESKLKEELTKLMEKRTKLSEELQICKEKIIFINKKLKM